MATTRSHTSVDEVVEAKTVGTVSTTQLPADTVTEHVTHAAPCLGHAPSRMGLTHRKADS